MTNNTFSNDFIILRATAKTLTSNVTWFNIIIPMVTHFLIFFLIIGYSIYKAFPDIKTPEDVSELAATYSHEIGYAILFAVVIAIAWMAIKNYPKSIERHVQNRGKLEK